MCNFNYHFKDIQPKINKEKKVIPSSLLDPDGDAMGEHLKELS